jgi:retron-type reverse transcriptase
MSILESISHDLMVPEASLGHIIRSAPYRYKVFEVDKKNGTGKRTIAQPARELKAIQYWVMANVLRQFPIHGAAMAYRKRRSISTNAAKHASNRFLLKLDFKDFFHSIKADDLEAFLAGREGVNLSTEDIFHLKKILFWNRRREGSLIMSIGAPSSPMLSNILMYEFDKKVQAFCGRKRVKYTRYADDLTFSTDRPNILREVEVQVAEICKRMEHPKLSLNTEKTVHASRGGARRVTGLVLANNGTVSLGHDRKRLIRAQVHHFLAGRLSPDEAVKLRGMLAFVNSAEPSFIQNLRDHYGSTEIDRIINLQD